MEEAPVVEISDGQLRGTLKTNINRETIYSFLGIPYAEPPLGKLRFKDPLPMTPWKGIKDARKEGEPCYQRDFFKKGIIGSEDCLTLNVFSKILPGDVVKKMPVMVWIHGGGFANGSNSIEKQGPEYLLTEDIVLVMINYRLGVLGFLSLDDLELGVPGNAGLKDQTLALQWVRKNIEYFNGDPGNVTIFGCSAGGASVHFHLFSPLSRGLFHKAIVQSGSAFNSWPYGKKLLFEVLDKLGKSTMNEKEGLDILKNTPVDALLEAQLKLTDEKRTELQVLGLIIETPHDGAFITKHPAEIIHSGEYQQVPLLIGYTSNEGLVVEFLTLVDKFFGCEANDGVSLEDVIAPEMNVKPGSELSQLICRKLEAVYSNGRNLDNKYAVFSDGFFVTGVLAAVKNHLLTSSFPIYLYRMSLDAGLNGHKRLLNVDDIPGACHGDEVTYLFKDDGLNLDTVEGEIERTAVRRFVKLWTNFAKFGNPTPEESELGIIWKPVEEGNMYCLDINEQLTLKIDPESSNMEVWKEIYHMSPNTSKYL